MSSRARSIAPFDTASVSVLQFCQDSKRREPLNRQPNSRHCFLCGVDNPIGLKLGFYDVGDGRVATRFTPLEQHQGYPGVMHGGIACALLDETIGRTLDQHQISGP